MTLAFPNISRRFDPAWGCVRFWGHDGAIEVAFRLEVVLLQQLGERALFAETDILAAFDALRDRVVRAAARRYSPMERRLHYVLALHDFD